MVRYLEGNLRLLLVVFFLCSCLSLIGCWGSLSESTSFSTKILWFDLNYDGNIDFERVWLKNDDMDEILDLYQEVWDGIWFRDSLLIAEKYAQWLWSNAFAQRNLDTLNDQWLTLSEIKKTQIRMEKNWENTNATLVEYQITEWLIDKIPVLYVSQLFVPKDNIMLLMSYITEDKSSYLSASKMFKNIK